MLVAGAEAILLAMIASHPPGLAGGARWRRAAFAASLVVLVALPLAGARATPAEPPPDEARPAPGWFLLPGLSLGTAATVGSGGSADWAFSLGGEVSAVYLWGTTWAGVYADGLWATPGDGGRLGAGAEVGWALLGLELGWVAKLAPRLAGEPVRHGLRVGALVTLGGVASYLRWVHLPAASATVVSPGGPSPAGAENIVELGLLLKWPLGLSDQR